MGDARLSRIKKRLAHLIESGPRYVSCEAEQPSKWWFGSIIDPRTNTCFTNAGAWEFIAECLRDDHSHVQEIILKKPPGETAYVLKVQTEQGQLYIKLQIAKGTGIIGRSFHLSEKE